VPDVTPVTEPVLLTVATVGEADDHVPPALGLLSGEVIPVQRLALPEIVPAFGAPDTVTTALCAAVPQVLVSVFTMVPVPGARPMISPALVTVTTEGLLVAQVPDPAVSVSRARLPVQMFVAPERPPEPTGATTVMFPDTRDVPQLPVAE